MVATRRRRPHRLSRSDVFVGRMIIISYRKTRKYIRTLVDAMCVQTNLSINTESQSVLSCSAVFRHQTKRKVAGRRANRKNTTRLAKQDAGAKRKGRKRVD